MSLICAKIQRIAANAILNAQQIQSVMKEVATLAPDTRIATGNRLTFQMTLQTAGNAVKSAM